MDDLVNMSVICVCVVTAFMLYRLGDAVRRRVVVDFVFMSANGVTPKYARRGDSGADLCAAHGCTLGPGERARIPTGIAVELPRGYELQVRPRSGVGLKHGIIAAFGTIDNEFRGEIGVMLVNHGDAPFEVKPGMRIAQAVVAPVVHARFREVSYLSPSERGTGGFGHTGMTMHEDCKKCDEAIVAIGVPSYRERGWVPHTGVYEGRRPAGRRPGKK